MAFMDWNANLSVGIPSIDTQHMKLVGMINSLHEAMRSGKGQEVMNTTLSELKQYTLFHFSAEERLMKQHGYPDMAAHLREHEGLVSQIKDVESGKQDITTIGLIELLKKWLVKHIQGTDKKYAPFFVAKGVK